MESKKKNHSEKPWGRTGIKMQMQRMDLRIWGSGRVSWEELRQWHLDIYTTKCKIDSQWEAAAQHREISSVLRDHLEGWDREGGREMQEGGGMGIYVHVQLFTLLYSRNYHSIVKQLFSNKDVKRKKIINIKPVIFRKEEVGWACLIGCQK